jgi:hypothetical protein
MKKADASNGRLGAGIASLLPCNDEGRVAATSNGEGIRDGRDSQAHDVRVLEKAAGCIASRSVENESENSKVIQLKGTTGGSRYDINWLHELEEIAA